MYKLVITLGLLALSAVTYGQIQGVTDCGSSATDLVVWAGACTTLPCLFVRGNTYDIAFESTGTVISNTLPFIVNATILGVDATVMQGDGCTQLSCPTAIGHRTRFVYQYTVSTIFPPVPSNVLTLVSNHNGHSVVCFRFPIQIV